jgi:hypothetical protein
MHGCAPGSGGPRGERSGKFKHGRYTREAKEVSAFFREMRRDADELTAVTMHKAGLRPVKAIRRRRHVRKALAEVKAAAAKVKEETK